MAETENVPDFKSGFPVGDLQEGGLVIGQVDGEDAILVRSGNEFFAVGAHCPHYHGPLADGLIVGDTVRCPWHHACFNLRTGAPERAPALDPIACWQVERHGDRIVVREKRSESAPASLTVGLPASIVIIGGGAAGLAAADVLRR